MLESLRAKAVVEGAFCTWFTAQVGYHASKEAFGRIWDMRITAGDGGPVFTVSMQHKLASCHQRGRCLPLLGRCCDTPACGNPAHDNPATIIHVCIEDIGPAFHPHEGLLSGVFPISFASLLVCSPCP